MKRSVLFFAVLALAFTFTSAPAIAQEKPQMAQDVSKEITAAVLPEINVSGTWEIDLTMIAGAGTAKMTLQLTQNGEEVTGTSQILSSKAAPPREVIGTLKGNTLHLKIPSIAFGYITAVINGDTMVEGKYQGRGRVNEFTGRKVQK